MNATAETIGTSLHDRFAAQRAAFLKNPYPPAKERRVHLNNLRKALLGYQEKLAKAIDQDFGGRSRTEVLFSEFFVSVNAIRHSRAHVKAWMSRQPREIDWPLQPGRAYVLPQPVGVVGIISPWNYPIFLAMGPIAGALAAGNRVILKPSEYTPATSELLAAMIAETFAPDHVTVVTGDSQTGMAFAALPFDHLLFTGSTAVGRQIMHAAAENLTPVTLELGGKSPALVAPDANIERAAADIVYGKLINAGQTCIAPDYVLVAADRIATFVEAARTAIEKYYPEPTTNQQYTAVVNAKQYDRLRAYLEEAHAAGVETVTVGPETPQGSRRMAPTLVIDPPDHLRIMQDEVFGPILPIKPYTHVDEAIAYVNSRPRPLALYVFSGQRKTIEAVLTNTVSGGVCVNDTLMHIVADDLPFGGTGASGMGHYHGREGFNTFSKLKPVFERRWIGLSATLRPPYSHIHEWMRRILIR